MDLRDFLWLRLLLRFAPPWRGIGTFGAPTPPGKLAHKDVGVPSHETGAGIITSYSVSKNLKDCCLDMVDNLSKQHVFF